MSFKFSDRSHGGKDPLSAAVDGFGGSPCLPSFLGSLKCYLVLTVTDLIDSLCPGEGISFAGARLFCGLRCCGREKFSGDRVKLGL